jgi:hypothetical protein
MRMKAPAQIQQRLLFLGTRRQGSIAQAQSVDLLRCEGAPEEVFRNAILMIQTTNREKRRS